MDQDRQARSAMLILVSGVALSTVLGVVFYFRTDVNTALATFAGLIGTTITLQVESLVRARRGHEAATRQQRLVAQMEATAWMPELLDRALGAYHAIERTHGSTMAVELAHEIFEDTRLRLEELRRGRYVSPDSDESPRSAFYRLTERLRTSMLATSAGSDLDWWQDPSESRIVWRLNEQALRRGVTITRIFIYRTWTDELDAVAKTHHAAGVHVLRVAERQLPPMLRLNLVIWDATCAHEPQYNTGGEWISSSFTSAEQDLAVMLDRFKQIESQAEPWPPNTGA
jgi:hypothetical protein